MGRNANSRNHLSMAILQPTLELALLDDLLFGVVVDIFFLEFFRHVWSRCRGGKWEGSEEGRQGRSLRKRRFCNQSVVGFAERKMGHKGQHSAGSVRVNKYWLTSFHLCMWGEREA